MSEGWDQVNREPKTFVVDADPQFVANCDKIAASHPEMGNNRIAATVRIDNMNGRIYISTDALIMAELEFDRRSSKHRAYQDAFIRNGMTLGSVDAWRREDGWRMRVYVDRDYLA